MKHSKPKFTAADRKALALAAFLFYSDREYQVELMKPSVGDYLELRVTREDTQSMEQCPLLNWPFIRCEVARVGYSDIVSTWYIPLNLLDL